MPKRKQKSAGRQPKPKSAAKLDKKVRKTILFWQNHLKWNKNLSKQDIRSIVLVAQVYPISITAMVLAALLRVNVRDPGRTSMTKVRNLVTEPENLKLDVPVAETQKHETAFVTRIGLILSQFNH